MHLQKISIQTRLILLTSEFSVLFNKMASRMFIRSKSIAFNTLRTYSSSTKLVDVSINDKTGIATVTMQRPPVNSLNLELLTELNGALQDLGSKKIKGAILTSVRINIINETFI